jgi:hypothetical protein
MRFEIERRADGARRGKGHPGQDDWEPVGECEGTGEQATASAVEQVGEIAGIYRARPAGTDERWAFYLLDVNGVAHQHEGIA